MSSWDLQVNLHNTSTLPMAGRERIYRNAEGLREKNLPFVMVVVLKWNGLKDTLACLHSLENLSYPAYRILLVDNGSTDNSVQLLAQRFPTIEIVQNDKNLGFCEGNNVGIRYALDQHCDYVLILNNDTVVENDFLSFLVDTAETSSRIGIVGPKILFRHRPDHIWYAGGYLSKTTLRCKHRGFEEKDDHTYDTVVETDLVSGCCMLIKRSVLEAIGGFDPRYGFYNEDLDLCMRARAHGFLCVYDGRARIYHNVEGSMNTIESSFVVYYRVRNTILFAKRWFPSLLPQFAVFYIPVVGKHLLEYLLTGQWNAIGALLSAISDGIRGHYGLTWPRGGLER